MPKQNDTAPWRGQPVVLYDRCVTPDDPLLADRLRQCRQYAATQDCAVVAVCVDYGHAATLDGRTAGGWLDVAAVREALRDAVARASRADTWLLVWHPDRLSAYSGCRRMVVARVGGRVLRVGRGLVEASRFQCVLRVGAL